jgi:hypothetical protein
MQPLQNPPLCSGSEQFPPGNDKFSQTKLTVVGVKRCETTQNKLMIVKQGNNTGPPNKIFDRRYVYFHLFHNKKSQKENPV